MTYLQRIAGTGIIQSDLIPDVIREYETLQKNVQSSDIYKVVKPLAETLPKEKWKDMGVLPFEDGMLLSIAIPIAQMKQMTKAAEKLEQPSGVFFPLLQFGFKECPTCKAQNLISSQYCNKCGHKL